MRYQIINADAVDGLLQLDSESVYCCVTSPPYWMLRDYGVKGQIGLESSFSDYIDRLMKVFSEVHRVLRKDGTLWINMGDKYLGGSVAGMRAKNLIGAPWRLAFALQDAGWILRSDIVWYKPNPMPESVQDRPTKAHEYVFLFAKSRHYYYDQQAISEPVSGTAHSRGSGVYKKARDAERAFNKRRSTTVKPRQNASFCAAVCGHVERRNAHSVWPVTLQPRHDAHEAAYPDELANRCIITGCPEGGTVLDPFLGRGTTAIVALRTGRSAIGIELSPKYCEIAKRNIVADAPLFNTEDNQRRKP